MNTIIKTERNRYEDENGNSLTKKPNSWGQDDYYNSIGHLVAIGSYGPDGYFCEDVNGNYIYYKDWSS